MSSGKTVGFVFILVIMIMMFIAIFSRSGMPMPFLMKGCEGIGPVFGESMSHWGPRVFTFFPAMIMFAFWFVMIFWVFRDAERRGMNGLLWALLIFFGHIIALVVYLLVRNDQVNIAQIHKSSQPCPSCQKQVESGHTFCPHCGTKLQASCSSCKKPMEPGWQVCPYCGEKLT
ncbi:zinc-ribbon domain-containing protein [candidate division KSB1 bacterium]|nr:zinc-ribbon domain-containing protein [candidate division KSB1 bacterium]